MTWHPQTEKQNLGTLMAITSPSSLTCQLTVKKVQSQKQNIDRMLISMIAAYLPNNSTCTDDEFTFQAVINKKSVFCQAIVDIA